MNPNPVNPEASGAKPAGPGRRLIAAAAVVAAVAGASAGPSAAPADAGGRCPPEACTVNHNEVMVTSQPR